MCQELSVPAYCALCIGTLCDIHVTFYRCAIVYKYTQHFLYFVILDRYYTTYYYEMAAELVALLFGKY